MKNSLRFFKALALSSIALAAVSCDDEEYYLSQDIYTTVTIDGKIILPHAFSKCNISARTDLKNISLFSGDSDNLDADGVLSISTDLVNTFPLDLKITASPVGSDGKVLGNLPVTVEGRAAGVTLSSPSSSHFTITVKASKEELKAINI